MEVHGNMTCYGKKSIVMNMVCEANKRLMSNMGILTSEYADIYKKVVYGKVVPSCSKS